MKKRKTGKFKGMTLFEIIISLAVLSVMTLLLVRASSVINMYIRSANKVNQRTVEQSPVAEMGHEGAAHKTADDVKIIVRNPLPGAGSAEIELNGKAYEVVEQATDSNGNAVYNDSEFGGNLNMQFILIEEPTTTAPTTGP